jgi:MFS family permease
VNLLAPAGADPAARLLVAGRALRGFVDGYVAVLLPAYLLALGLPAWAVGVLSTATLLGSAGGTLAVGAWGHRFPSRRLLLGAALLMAGTGIAFASLDEFWPLLIVAFVGTLNPGSGDVSVFLPLEHPRLAASAQGDVRTTLFARYSLLGSLSAAFGALAAGVPAWLVAQSRSDVFRAIGPIDELSALRCMFIGYALVGVLLFLLYRRLPKQAPGPDAAATARSAPLRESRAVVFKLAALFSVDSFAGGLVVNSLMALWLMQRFEMSSAATGQLFFATGLLAAASMWAAPWVAKRIGLLNTMVFTHIPANVCLILAALSPELHLALGLLLVRSALSQMDVPTRSAFVMSVVTPSERGAAASLTAVPRSLAAAISPGLGGALFATGFLAAPLVAAGFLKLAYDVTLWFACRGHDLDAS